MERAPALMVATLSLLLNLSSLPHPSTAISSCNGPCSTLNDCDGQLICISGRCTDDPDVGTHVCKGSPSAPAPTTPPCKPSGTLYCKGKDNPTYHCSPPVTSSTRAILTENDFSEGGEGGGPSECDDKYHSNSEHILALSTGWYDNGSRCGQMIRLTSVKTGRSVTAKVVDECDSMHGCDKEHAGQIPCRYNIVDASSSVWHALGLDIDVGEEDITWSMA